LAFFGSRQPPADHSFRFLRGKSLYHFGIAFIGRNSLIWLGSHFVIRNMESILGLRDAKLRPWPREGVPADRARRAESDLRQLQRREWWLWLSASFVTTLSAVAFLLSSFPSLFRYNDHFYDLRSDQVRWAVMCLLLLFNGWLIRRQWSFRRRWRQLTGQNTGSGSPTARVSDPARLDPATGLYTRSFIEQQLGKEIARANRQNTSLSLATIHIDEFEVASKRYGLSATDMALKELARRLKKACRGSDFAVRWATADFLLLLPECGLSEVKLVLNRLGPLEFTCFGREIILTYTTGWVDYRPGERPSDLLKRASEVLRIYENAAAESLASTLAPH
jgi:diguanylate cyclase (GGDEF)-like protein